MGPLARRSRWGTTVPRCSHALAPPVPGPLVPSKRQECPARPASLPGRAGGARSAGASISALSTGHSCPLDRTFLASRPDILGLSTGHSLAARRGEPNSTGEARWSGGGRRRTGQGGRRSVAQVRCGRRRLVEPGPVAVQQRRLALPDAPAPSSDPGTPTRCSRHWPLPRAGLPVTARGAGTSIAGNAVGPRRGVDFATYMRTVVSIDPEARTAVVQPGVGARRAAAGGRPAGLRFGPDPSTHTRCTIGGMIGNNACGSRALGYGRTADNVVALDVAHGRRRAAATPRPRRRSGRRRDRARAVLDGLVARGTSPAHPAPSSAGSPVRSPATRWSTCCPSAASTSTASSSAPRAPSGWSSRRPSGWSRTRRHRALVVLGYPSMADAADAVPALLAHRPSPCEGLDSRIVDVVRGAQGAAPSRPARGRRLAVRRGRRRRRRRGTRRRRPVRRDGGHARRPRGRRPARGGRAVADPRGRRRARGRGPDAARPSPGWEDAAVPPERAGRLPARLRRAARDARAHGVPYGHFGDGCVHVRIDFPLDASPAARRVPRASSSDARRPGRGVRRLAVRRARRRPGPLASCCR